jgi:hypothetical protein
MLFTNALAKGHGPRIQAVVMLAAAALDTFAAYSLANQAETGKTECREDPDSSTDGSIGYNHCTGPLDYEIGAASFGLAAGFETGFAVYQLITGKQVIEPPRRFVIDPKDYPPGHPLYQGPPH